MSHDVRCTAWDPLQIDSGPQEKVDETIAQDHGTGDRNSDLLDQVALLTRDRDLVAVGVGGVMKTDSTKVFVLLNKLSLQPAGVVPTEPT